MKSLTLSTVLLLASLTSCDSGCVRLFAPKAKVTESAIAQRLSPNSAGDSQFDHDEYGELLEAHVDYEAGRVDYSGLSDDERQLDAYLADLADADVDRLDADAQLALLINAYNAFTLKLILDHYPDIESIKDISKPWDETRWTLAGVELSLNEIEHGLIRPIYRDSRIHFAVNCASIGCPPLAPWPYTGERLDEQLDRAAERTLGDQRYARVEDGVLEVTPLLNWYRADFVSEAYNPSADTVPSYVALFGDRKIREFIEQSDDPPYAYLSYDWSLNDVD
jgi:hypothetical protein